MTNPAQFSAAEIYDMAIETEQNGYVFYEAAAQAARSQEVRKLMDFLAQAEKEHEATFTAMKQKSSTHQPPETYPGERQEYIDALLLARVLPDKETGLRAIAAMTADEQAIDFAIGFEKDTILFLHEMAKIVPPGEVEQIEALIAQERDHVRILVAKKANPAG